MPTETSSADRASAGPIAWAAFLACSWTWCIGMFLPVLLIERFGLWGWTVFTIPNILGAAAMGWILRKQESSDEIVKRHANVCIWFSVATILYHIVFVGWLIAMLVGLPVALLTLVVALGLWLAGRRRPGCDLRVGQVVFCFSIGAAVACWAVVGMPHWPPPQAPAMFAGNGVAALAPACLLGFFLCPYLDLTFHRARVSMSADSARIAFTLGFGVFFLVMLLFTLIYSPWVIGVLRGEKPTGPLVWIVALHMLIQSAFTIAMHLREIEPCHATGPARPWLLATITLACMILLAGACNWFTQAGPAVGRGERLYLLFLSLYGLLFPAYVWLCMLPAPDGTSGPTPTRLVVLALVILLAAPMYWAGFMQGQTIWLLPAVAMVLGSRWLLPRAAATRPCII